MVGPALRELLVRGEGAGECTGPGVGRGVAEHPVCGDQVQLSVQVVAGAIADLRWRAAGCPASLAVAALAAKVLVGVPVPGAADALRAAIAGHGGLAAAERHAKALVLHTLTAATGSH